jgi:hypothetical protein
MKVDELCSLIKDTRRSLENLETTVKIVAYENNKHLIGKIVKFDTDKWQIGRVKDIHTVVYYNGDVITSAIIEHLNSQAYIQTIPVEKIHTIYPDKAPLLKFDNEDLLKVIGYTLYDLHTLGYLNDKGSDIVNSTKEIPKDILKELGEGINNYLRDKQENGKVN